MIEIRIHGRGGQGNVAAAYLLAAAGFDAGLEAQAFPVFGAERRGAPVTAFVRLARRPIRQRCQVAHPDFLIVQDPTLLNTPGTLAGLKEGGGVLLNAGQADHLDIDIDDGGKAASLPATRIAEEILGRPVPNVALLAAFLTLTGIAPLDGLRHAVDARFKGPVAEKNRRVIDAAAECVEADAWREESYALSA